MSADKATMVELDTVLGIEDLYDILEVLRVDARNRRIVRAAHARRNREG